MNGYNIGLSQDLVGTKSILNWVSGWEYQYADYGFSWKVHPQPNFPFPIVSNIWVKPRLFPWND